MEASKTLDIRYKLLDNILDVRISKSRSKETYKFEYIDNSDLLIIGFCLEGNALIDYQCEKTVRKGEVFYLRPTADFTVETCNHYVLYYFIDLDKLRGGLNKQCICQRGEIIKEKAHSIIKGYIDEIKQINHIEMDSFLEYADTKGKLLNYLTWLIKLRLDKTCEADKTQCEICYINQAKKIIIDNLERQVTVKEISEKLGVSIYILQKNFKQVKGTTVYDYIRRMKINNSKILLKETSDSIIEISHKTGYENPSKFSAAFKNITGYTPTEYRRL